MSDNNGRQWTYEDHRRLVEFTDSKIGGSMIANGSEIGLYRRVLNDMFMRNLSAKTWQNRLRIARADVAKQARIEAAMSEKRPIEVATQDLVGKWIECIDAGQQNLTLGKIYKVLESGATVVRVNDDNGDNKCFFIERFTTCGPPEQSHSNGYNRTDGNAVTGNVTTHCQDCAEKDAEINRLIAQNAELEDEIGCSERTASETIEAMQAKIYLLQARMYWLLGRFEDPLTISKEALCELINNFTPPSND